MNNIPDGFKQTEVGVIPRDWEVKKLGDLVDKFVNGGTPSTKVSDYWKGEIPWITGADILNQKIFVIRRYISREAVKNSTTNIIEKNNLLLVSRTGVGKLAITPFDVAISQDFTGVYTKKSALDTGYLFRYLDFAQKELTKQNQGTSIQGITREALASIPIPLPPTKAEQTAIATALNDADKLITQLEKLIAKKRNIKQGAMQQLLTGKKRLPGFGSLNGKPKSCKQTEIGVIPEDWAMVKVNDITINHRQGYYTKDKYVNEGAYLVRITDLLNPKINYFGMPKLNISQSDFELYKIKKGDFLFARSGAIGRYGIVYEDVNAVFGSYIIRFTFDIAKVINEYFGFLYETELVLKQLLSITQGSSNININANNIKSIKISLPTLPEQTAIAQILSDMDAEIEALEKKLEKYKMLKQGMMQELLTGKTRLI